MRPGWHADCMHRRRPRTRERKGGSVVRTLMIGILAQLGLACASGCAPAPLVELVPRDIAASGSPRSRAMRMESSESTVLVQFAGPWRDWLVFDVTVTNHSDSVLRVEPEEFSMTLSTRHGRKHVGHAVWAVQPERTLERLDLGQSRESFFWGALLGLGAFVFLADRAGTNVDSGEHTPEQQDEHAEFSSNLAALLQSTEERGSARMADREDERWRWSRSALTHTLLEPGASVSGTVALPGARLRGLVGPDEPEAEAAAWAITGPTRRPAGYHRVTLHAPPALGRQRFEFDVGAR